MATIDPQDDVQLQAQPAAGQAIAADEHESVWNKGIDWPVVIWIVAIHVSALAAPFFFSWQAAVTACAARTHMSTS